MLKSIYFIENSIDFNGNDLNSNKIGGAEKILINLTNELAKDKNLEIIVYNNTSLETQINNVKWFSLKSINRNTKPDHLIAWSDANLLNKINSNDKYVWSHSVQPIEKFIRKKQFFPFIKNKPKVILEGEYHFKTRNFFTSPFGKHIIKVAPDYEFIDQTVELNNIPLPNAIFTTRSDRNLNFLLDCWYEISKKSKNSKLYINPPYELKKKDIDSSVLLRKPSTKANLINELLNSRVMLNPGHKGEVFCLAAEEAKTLCLPIVTMGIGSLYERVEHFKTGFIANSKEEFIKYSLDILTNDQVYLDLKRNLINSRGSRTYINVANDLLNLINK